MRKAMDDAPSASSLSLADEIRRLDEIGSTVFEVYIALVAGAAAVVLAIDDKRAQIAAIISGGVLAVVSLAAVPDVVFAAGQRDRTDESLRRYLKTRQRQTQFSILLLLLALAATALSIGNGIFWADLFDRSSVGIAVTLGLVSGCAVVAFIGRDVYWPQELRKRR
jgi:hypothetical protein